MAKINARLQHKIDIEANWLLTEERFTPLRGEFIIYDIDSNHSATRLKIGDGVTNVNQLPFAPFSAYDIAKANDPINTPETETEWIKSLKGIGIKDISQTQKSESSNGINEITITLTDNSIKSFEVQNGSQGEPGEIGATGTGISSISSNPTSEGTDFQIHLTDGTSSEVFSIKNGNDGVVTDDQLTDIKASVINEIQLRCETLVFNTYEELYDVLVGENQDLELIESFQTGDIFLIRALDSPDYWWEKQDTNSVSLLSINYANEIEVPGYGIARILETQKTDLNYYLGLDDGTQGDLDLKDYKIRVTNDTSDTGLSNYITFIV